MTCTSREWFVNIIEKIKNEVDVHSNLAALKVAVISLNSSQLAFLTPNLKIDVIFDCLNTSDGNQILECCEILKLILPSLPISLLLTKFKPELNRALIHPEKEVKEVALQQLIQSVPDPSLLNELERDPSLLKNAMACLYIEELAVVNLSIKFLTKLGKIPEGLAIICDPTIKQTLIEGLSRSNVYKIRLYQVIIDISVESQEALETVRKEGFVEGLYELLSCEDILSRLALVEEISKLSLTAHGFKFLRKEKLLELLVKQLEENEQDSLSSCIYPGIFKFFGNLGQKYPSELFSCFPNIFIRLFDAVDSDEVQVSISSLEAISFIATSSIGKSILKSQDKNYLEQVFNQLQIGIKNLSSDWKAKAVNCVANIIHLEDVSLEKELSQTCQEWFELISSDSVMLFFQMAQQPFPDLRLAAMQVIFELASHRWGQIKMKSCPGLMDFILDRSTENTLQGMQMKYDIIFNIVRSPSGSDCFEDNEYWALKDYIKQGPCFAPTLTEVAIEGQD